MISVIVPVYNTAKYLGECVESILRQGVSDIEVLLIDDGSTDGSEKLCNDYANRDCRVKVHHQSNSGVTAARRVGLAQAQGEWVAFVDSDDTLPPHALQLLLGGTVVADTDMVVGRFYDSKDEIYKRLDIDTWRRYCIARQEFLPGPWCRLIRKSLFNSSTLDIPRDIVKGEDMLMNIRLAFDMTKDIVIVNRKVYNYRRNPTSVVHTFMQDATYEQRFHELRLKSIPNKWHENYRNELIHVRLLELNEMYMDAPLNAEWMESDFYGDLCRDIKKAHYHPALIERIKFGLGFTMSRKRAWQLVQLDYRVYLLKCRVKVFIKKILGMR